MPLHKDSLYSKYFYPVTFAILGGGTPALSNYVIRRPFYSGIQRHFIGAALGYAVGYYIDRYLQNRYAQRDAVIKHYIELHPEDFVENKRKYKEIFEEWYPIRGAS
ncbi:NADH dehydrogenase [ubiquinone] 1 subunit C2-like [Argiope bruennichi]|uniref:NADH dehydrogenase [ubiquinone] 1 subunit C2 n=1 Tax=Argiope bruennichi TaxID=94029 RepID=A0A8T0E327_ARGBR|nr:NADH dehydrogenase [ubiquinone] 1 subunit C2-like [Argiope bruennichi]KAF8764595.1 NADH dehydrogenase 1 subunit C2 like protein [Argiope bruennichi]